MSSQQTSKELSDSLNPKKSFLEKARESFLKVLHSEQSTHHDFLESAEDIGGFFSRLRFGSNPPSDNSQENIPISETSHQTFEQTKEKVSEMGEKMGIKTQNSGQYSETLKDFGATASDKVSDAAQRMKPEDRKSFLEKTREGIIDTTESTTEKFAEIGEKLGFVSQHHGIVDEVKEKTSELGKTVKDNAYELGEKVKDLGAETADKVSEVAEEIKPEDRKSYLEKVREGFHETTETTKEKLSEIGEKLGIISQKSKENTGFQDIMRNVSDEFEKPEDLGKPAHEKAQNMEEKAKEMGNQAYDKTKEKGSELYEKGRDLGNQTKEKAKKMGNEVYEKGKEMGNQAYDKTKEKGGELYEKGKEMGNQAYDKAKEKGGELYEKGRDLGTKATEKAKDIGSQAADKVSDAAQRMKPEDRKSFAEKAREGLHRRE